MHPLLTPIAIREWALILQDYPSYINPSTDDVSDSDSDSDSVAVAAGAVAAAEATAGAAGAATATSCALDVYALLLRLLPVSGAPQQLGLFCG